MIGARFFDEIIDGQGKAAVEIGGLGYAFPYDDVHPSGGVDVEGKVQSGNPNRLTITVNNPQ